MDEVFKHWTGRVVFTQGVHWLAVQAKAFWLIDAVASHQLDKKVRAEEFQHWTLTVAADRSATLHMTDGNEGPPIVVQKIEFTDYPEEVAEFYLVFDAPGQPATLMLPCEY